MLTESKSLYIKYLLEFHRHDGASRGAFIWTPEIPLASKNCCRNVRFTPEIFEQVIPLEVRDRAKGPLVVEITKCPVVAHTPQRQEGHEELAVVVRYLDRDQQDVVKIDFYLCNARRQTPLMDLARVAKYI